MSSSNKLLKDLNTRLEEKFSRSYADQSMTEWIIANTTLRGRPFSIKGYEFQRAICDDMHPNMDVKKCAQIGLTEVQIRKALAFVARNHGVSLIFTLPEEKLFRKISQTRIKPIVDKDKVFNLEQDDDSVRSMSILQFGSSFMYVTACTEGDATSTAADAVFNDEVDLSDQRMLALFNSRMQNSDYRINQRFSTPSFPAFGIDLGFNSSDQRLLLRKCSGCNHWNWPQFNLKFCHLPGLPERIENTFEIDDQVINDIDLLNAYVMCEKCGTPLTHDDDWEWVAKYPNRVNARGYWITPFSTTRLGLPYLVDQLLKYKKNNYIRGFYNTVLGETYSDSNTQITFEDIESSFGASYLNELPTSRPLSIGIDMGQTCHVVIGDDTGNHIFRFVAVAADNLVEYVKDLFSKYTFVAGACDRLPYTPTANQLRDLTKGIIIPVQYEGSPKAGTKLMEDDTEKIDYALVNRTRALDEVSRSFRERSMKLEGYAAQREVIKEHLRDMVRDEKPEQPAVWRKLTGHDHYFHAIGYYKLGLKLQEAIRLQAGDDEIRTMHSFGIATLGKNDDYVPGNTRANRVGFGRAF